MTKFWKWYHDHWNITYIKHDELPRRTWPLSRENHVFAILYLIFITSWSLNKHSIDVSFEVYIILLSCSHINVTRNITQWEILHIRNVQVSWCSASQQYSSHICGLKLLGSLPGKRGWYYEQQSMLFTTYNQTGLVQILSFSVIEQAWVKGHILPFVEKCKAIWCMVRLLG